MFTVVRNSCHLQARSGGSVRFETGDPNTVGLPVRGLEEEGTRIRSFWVGAGVICLA